MQAITLFNYSVYLDLKKIINIQVHRAQLWQSTGRTYYLRTK